MFIDNRKFNAALLKFTEPEQWLAKNSGIALSTWLSAKKGTHNIRPATICRIAKTLKVDPIELIKTDDGGAA